MRKIPCFGYSFLNDLRDLCIPKQNNGAISTYRANIIQLLMSVFVFRRANQKKTFQLVSS